MSGGGTQFVTKLNLNGVEVFVVNGDPNGAVAAPAGSTAFRVDVPSIYQNQDGATSWFRVDGIVPPHYALGNPTTLQELVARLDESYRPTLSLSSQPATVYVEEPFNGGNDANDGATPATPIATWQRATQYVADVNQSQVVVQFGPGTFDVPLSFNGTRQCFRGTTSNGDTLTINAGSVVNAEGLLQVTVTSTGGPYLAGELKNTLIEFVNGGPAGLSGFIESNQASVGPDTVLSITQTNLTGPVSSPPDDGSGQLQIKVFETTFKLPMGQPEVSGSVLVEIEEAIVTSDFEPVWTMVNSDAVRLRNLLLTDFAQLRAGGFGRAFLTNVAVDLNGVGGPDGVIRVTNGGFMQLQAGTLIDCDDTAAARRFIKVDASGILTFLGQIVVRTLLAFQADQAALVVVDTALGPGETTVRFSDFDGVGCTDAYVFNASAPGGFGYHVPESYGTILNPFLIKAQRGANVLIAPSTNLQTSSGLGTANAVAADGGASGDISADAVDNTYISGGSFPPGLVWFTVGDAGAPAFENSWTNIVAPANTFGNVQYAKDHRTGIVYLRGGAAGGVVNTTLFTLPVGYRPAVVGGGNREFRQSMGPSGAGSQVGGSVRILASSGAVIPVEGSDVTRVMLDGIDFNTENVVP